MAGLIQKGLGMAALGLLCSAVQAHDSWLSQAAPARDLPGPPAINLEVVTGNVYPVMDLRIARAALKNAQCRQEGRPLTVRVAERATPGMLLSVQPRAQDLHTVACWVEIIPFTVEIAPPVVEVYFAEIRPNDQVRQAWKDMQARGVGWRESYRKFIQIEIEPLGAAAQAGSVAARSETVGRDFEAVLENTRRPIRVGDEMVIRLLRKGQPWADQPLQMLAQSLPVGVWGQTDAEGRVRFKALAAGPLIVRGTELRLSATERDLWESLFMTFGLDIAP